MSLQLNIKCIHKASIVNFLEMIIDSFLKSHIEELASRDLLLRYLPMQGQRKQPPLLWDPLFGYMHGSTNSFCATDEQLDIYVD